MRISLAVIFISLMLAGTVIAIHDLQYYDTNIDSYGGQVARDRRTYDPNSRARYFGYGYDPQLVNFGMKGPADRLTQTGAKGAYSSIFNLDTNSYTNRGRDPGFLSNWDPNMRGYARLDRAVYLYPYSPVQQIINDDVKLAKGAARLISLGDQYGAGQNKPYPETQVYLQVRDLPPVGDGEIYEAWLFDSETEYPLKIGLVKSATQLTGQLLWEFRRKIDMFDEVWITKEPFPDPDPNPSELVLVGLIDPPRRELNPDADVYSRLR